MLILLVHGVGMGASPVGGAVDPYLFYYNYRRHRTHDAIAKKKAIKKRRRKGRR